LTGNDEWFEQEWTRMAGDWEAVFGPVSSWSSREREALELFEPPRRLESWEVAGTVAGLREGQRTVRELRSLLSACGIVVPLLSAKVDRLDRPIVVAGYVTAADAQRIAVVLRAGLRALRIPPAAR
jgi:hypothetical protein